MSGEEKVREYKISDLDKIWMEYDRQNDILYINFGYDIEDADEEFLSGDGDIVVRIKNRRVVSLMIMNFSDKANIIVY
ncbi:DUF2283 domain-containing protein [Staphylothermus hellenicus]|uniref:DUF2283 domain-containing protein n=1 Tax=Staphylothermus hellenicus (strain DSM 12710 / JCM 10830 / BK20S6-10-b1 / P8) TaxID=591019 RepID=D7DAL5_STAHD|nr:DUF2283 domain-containing protein [Staphylothermus hellenicus]ADI31212.1 hypothetical protein Shell_0063 [Staphylothermus hellenicus DSM 12710]